MPDKIKFPTDWDWDEEGYVICPDCGESMLLSNTDLQKEHSPDCEYVKLIREVCLA